MMSPETQELVEKQQMVGELLQAESVPSNSHVRALTCERDCRIVTLFGEGGLCRGDRVKMESLGKALIQYDCCPYKRRNFRQAHSEGR